MIAAATRLDQVQEYYFAGKLREIAQMQQEGKPVINLGIGSPDLPPAPAVIEALQTAAADPRAHAYQSYTGIPAQREAWANWYQRFYGAQLDPVQEILPLMGSKEGIMHVAMAFLEPGDIALTPNPGYPTYRAASLLAGATVQYYDLTDANNWLPDFEQLEQTDLSRVKLMWVNYPHMPTGAPGSAEVFEKLVAFGKKHNILIINDNPYSFILNNHPRSILAVPGAKEIAMELNSLSKSHNMAGWRVGMIAGHADYIKTVLRFKSNMDSGQFQAQQRAVVAALELPDSWYAELNSVYAQRQQVAFEILRSLDCTFDPQQQGMFVWARIPDHYRDCYELSDRLLHEAHVFLTPGGIFGSNGDRFVRISLCSTVEALGQAKERIETRILVMNT